MGVYLETQVGHYRLELVLELDVSFGDFHEVVVENWVDEYLIPIEPFLLGFL